MISVLLVIYICILFLGCKLCFCFMNSNAPAWAVKRSWRALDTARHPWLRGKGFLFLHSDESSVAFLSSESSESCRISGTSFLDSTSTWPNSSLIDLRVPSPRDSNAHLNVQDLHSLMQRALEAGKPRLAVRLFERAFNFSPLSSPRAKEATELQEHDSSKQSLVTRPTITLSDPSQFLQPNQHVVTTAIKAYGRVGSPFSALKLCEWSEYEQSIVPDIYMLSALLYVLSKHQMVNEAEALFWQEIPRRGLKYNIVTANSIMFLYARIGRPDKALQVFELLKSHNLQGTAVTIGTLIKSLMFSGQHSMHTKALSILLALPHHGVQPTTAMFNQLLEYYASTRDMNKAKYTVDLMSRIQPPVPLDQISYGHLISCFVKQPHQAIAYFKEMVGRGIAPNEYAFMGLLRSLAKLRDGVAAVRIVKDMLERGLRVGQNHVSAAVFACILSQRYSLASTLIHSYLEHTRRPPGVVLCTLWLRVYLQQGKWDDAQLLWEKMTLQDGGYPPPNLTTYRTLLKHQILASDRWEEAKFTADTLLGMYSNWLETVGMEGAMLDGFETIAFALGCHSVQRQEQHQEDELFAASQTLLSSEERGLPAQHRQWRNRAVSDGRSEFTFPDRAEAASNDGSLEEAVNTASSGIVVADQLPVAGNADFQIVMHIYDEDARRAIITNLQSALAEEKDPVIRNDSNGPMLQQPSLAALQFCMHIMSTVAQHSNILVPSSFYAQLMRALLLEEQFTVCRQLIDMRHANQIRIKELENSSKHLIAAELLAEQAINEAIILMHNTQ